ncbi:MAG: class I SAM-dependent methyltransferase, partial [Myxococcota bacterium]|nr:class I SAM-dependent methyltransferase [Myxococcota bacterium]
AAVRFAALHAPRPAIAAAIGSATRSAIGRRFRTGDGAEGSDGIVAANACAGSPVRVDGIAIGGGPPSRSPASSPIASRISFALAKRATGVLFMARSTICASAGVICGSISASGVGLLGDREHQLVIVLRLEGPSPREHLVEDRADREHVAARVDAPPARLLRRHVRGRAEDRAGAGHRVIGVEHPRDAEVEQLDELHPADALHEHVLGLEIAMHDAALVRGRERGEHLHRDALHAPLGHPPLPLEQRAERLALEQVHHEEGAPVLDAEVGDLRDVRMRQRRGELRLALEARDDLGVLRDLRTQHLDRDGSAERLLHACVHGAHPAHPEEPTDAVATERRAFEELFHRRSVTGIAPRRSIRRSALSSRPMSDPSAEQARIYEERAEAYDALISAEDSLGELARALDRVVSIEGAVIADVGAGTGRIARTIGARARKVHLIDRAAPMLEVARRRLEAQGDVEFEIHHADARALPLADASCDAAIAGWVFGHFRHWMPEGWALEVDAAIAEMRRVVRPGGAIVVVETLGTGHATPRTHEALDGYFEHLERAHGFTRSWIRTDYQFADVETAARVCGSFFGEPLVAKIRAEDWARVPECTAIFSAPA